jgi:hypothetical protein
MSSRVFPGHTAHPPTPVHADVVGTHNASPAQALAAVRRRPSREQGMALETLGHAIEYLVDTYITAAPQLVLEADNPDQQAVQLLMRLNRAVFFECAAVKPWTTRLMQRLHLRH